MAPSPANMYTDLLRHDLYSFIHRSFLELNPQTQFLSNWHIEVASGEAGGRQTRQLQAPYHQCAASSSQIPCDVDRISGMGTGA